MTFKKSFSILHLTINLWLYLIHLILIELRTAWGWYNQMRFNYSSPKVHHILNIHRYKINGVVRNHFIFAPCLTHKDRLTTPWNIVTRYFCFRGEASSPLVVLQSLTCEYVHAWKSQFSIIPNINVCPPCNPCGIKHGKWLNMWGT